MGNKDSEAHRQAYLPRVWQDCVRLIPHGCELDVCKLLEMAGGQEAPQSIQHGHVLGEEVLGGQRKHPLCEALHCQPVCQHHHTSSAR